MICPSVFCACFVYFYVKFMLCLHHFNIVVLTLLCYFIILCSYALKMCFSIFMLHGQISVSV